jgi:tetratricopeptide (TPR) repeat protein
MIDILSLINDKSKLNSSTLAELQEIVEKYPFYQTARILYIANLFELHHKNFGEELRRASVLVQDRSPLFLLTEGVHYSIDHIERLVSNIETENDDNRTISLIDSFLSQSKEEKENRNGAPRSVPSIADLTNDYAAFLMQKDNETSEEEDAPKLKGINLIDSFIQETQGRQRISIPGIGTEEEQEFASPEITEEDEEVLTETMVNIYIKQGRYAQALEILRKICLNNPKKSAYFANQMKLLQLVINESEA